MVEAVDDDLYRGKVVGAWGFGRPVALWRLDAPDAAVAEYLQDVAAVRHPGLLTPIDLASDGRDTFLVCEWVEGVGLDALCASVQGRGERVPWHLVTAIGVSVLEALEAAHAAGHAHGDVRPSTIVVSDGGAVYVAGLGFGDEGSDAVDHLAYRAPELAGADDATVTSDLFAVGAVLFEALAGRRPFDGNTAGAVREQVARGDVPDLSLLRDDMPPLAAITIERALRPAPDRRYPSARAMARALAGLPPASEEPPALVGVELARLVATVERPPRRESERVRVSAPSKSDRVRQAPERQTAAPEPDLSPPRVPSDVPMPPEAALAPPPVHVPDPVPEDPTEAPPESGERPGSSAPEPFRDPGTASYELTEQGPFAGRPMFDPAEVSEPLELVSRKSRPDDDEATEPGGHAAPEHAPTPRARRRTPEPVFGTEDTERIELAPPSDEPFGQERTENLDLEDIVRMSITGPFGNDRTEHLDLDEVRRLTVPEEDDPGE